MNKVRTVSLVAAMLLASPLLAACPLDKGLDGTVTDVIDNQGPMAEIKVKDYVDQPSDQQPWVTIEDQYLDTCVISANYPQCKTG